MASSAEKFAIIKDSNLFAFDKYSQEVLWVILIGAIANNLIPYSSDQAVVQRYISTPTEKKAAKAIYFHLSQSTSMWDSFISLIGLVGGPMAGLFLLGIFTCRASGASAVIAAVVSISLSMYLKFGDVPIHGKLFGGIGIAITMFLGYLLGFVLKGDETKTQGLTIYSLRPEHE